MILLVWLVFKLLVIVSFLAALAVVSPLGAMVGVMAFLYSRR